MKVLTIDYIKTFDPCKSGLDNLIKHYPKLNCTMEEFLALEYIPYDDKIWLAVKIVDIKILQQWSVECAEHVLSNYEDRYTNDNRIRNCIETIKGYLLGECSLDELMTACSAARSAAYYAAYSADSAHSAACSAYYAAYSAADSTADSTYSAADSAADSADLAADSTADFEQEDINLSILIALINNKGC